MTDNLLAGFYIITSSNLAWTGCKWIQDKQSAKFYLSIDLAYEDALLNPKLHRRRQIRVERMGIGG